MRKKLGIWKMYFLLIYIYINVFLMILEFERFESEMEERGVSWEHGNEDG